MNKSRLFGVLVLAVLFCSVVSFRAVPRTAAQAPLSILVYTQYADTTLSSPSDTYCEFVNTMAAINASYGTNYVYENLTNYNNLATEITGHNVFLIMDPEEAPTTTTLRTIGTAWATTLQNFVQGGGIVIQTDFYMIAGIIHGAGAHIFNESGLMTIGNASTVVGDTVTLVTTPHALTVGVSASWTASDGCVSVENLDAAATAIVTDVNDDAVVLHKGLGAGHIVYFGFDYYIRDTNIDTLLGNALSLQPTLPPIPGFPIEAVAIGLLLCFGLGVVMRRRRKVN